LVCIEGAALAGEITQGENKEYREERSNKSADIHAKTQVVIMFATTPRGVASLCADTP
jgi:hypothetical protein